MNDYINDKELLYNDFRYLMACRNALNKYGIVSDISNDKFFKCCIYSDLVSNCLSILLNISQDNAASIGVDNNCRTLLEALGIIEMEKQGYVKDANKETFRWLSLSISFSNLSKTQKEKYNVYEAFKTSDLRNKLLKAVTKQFGCTEKRIDKSLLGEPALYLMSSLDDSTSIQHILKEHGINLNKDYYYELFSIMIHPRYEQDKDIETGILSIRLNAVMSVVSYAVDFIKEKFKNMDTSYISSLDETIEGIQNLMDTPPRLKKLCQDAGLICKSHTELIYPYYFDKISYLYCDLYYCFMFGFYDMVTPKIKSLLELQSVISHLESFKDENERHYKIVGFLFGSRLQIRDYCLNDSHIDISGSLQEGLNFIFDNYYRDAYGLTDVEYLEKRLDQNSLYALDIKPHSYKGLVKEYAKDRSRTDKISESVIEIYNVSLDMEHASGYNFCLSIELSMEYATISMLRFTEMIQHLIQWIDNDFKKIYPDLDLVEERVFLQRVYNGFENVLNNLNAEANYQYQQMMEDLKEE